VLEPLRNRRMGEAQPNINPLLLLTNAIVPLRWLTL
jgi:hypothetical protein